MITYVVLVRLPGVITYTPTGVRIPKDIVPRIERIREGFRAAGADVKFFETTTGRYDAVAVLGVEEEGILTRALETVSKLGSVRVESLRALAPAELEEIIARPMYA